MGIITLKEHKAKVGMFFNLAEQNLKNIDKCFSYNNKAEDFPDQFKKNEKSFKQLYGFVFNNMDISTSPENEIKVLMVMLYRLRDYYCHYICDNQSKNVDENEKKLLERYYNLAVEQTKSENVKLEIFTKNNNNANKLTDEGVLFLLCMFLKTSQANTLIGSISGFKRSDSDGMPRRNLFTFYSVR